MSGPLLRKAGIEHLKNFNIYLGIILFAKFLLYSQGRIVAYTSCTLFAIIKFREGKALAMKNLT